MGVLRPKYVYLPPDERGPLRDFKPVPEALPPFPWRLCDQNFATHATFMQHVRSKHHGWPEYRKRLFYLAEQLDGVQPVRPQDWRQCVDAFSEHLVTGSADWPACSAPAESGEAGAASQDAPRNWWKAPAADGEVPPGGTDMAPVDIDALGAAPAESDVAGADPGQSRRAVRARIGCCVCARLHWADELQLVHFWRQPPDAPERSLLCDDQPQRPSRAELQKAAEAEEATESAGAQAQAMRMTQRQRAHALLDPARYHARWRFAREGADGTRHEGGIPLRELEASAVRDPGPDGKLWLLHKKCFRMVEQGGQLVADATQRVPICTGCHGALTKRVPTMPTFALANDLWIGRVPPPLRKLTLGAKLLLPIARGIVRRFHCKTDSAAWAPVEERIKAFVGNFVAFPQADGGRQVLSLPPRETDLVESVQIVFAGSDPAQLKG